MMCAVMEACWTGHSSCSKAGSAQLRAYYQLELLNVVHINCAYSHTRTFVITEITT
jgi:hypothetical protein